MNDVKHRLCYLSLDFDAELALTRFKGKKNTIKREFVLPDFVNTFEGRIRDPNAPAAEAAATAAAAAAAAAPAAAPDASKKKTYGKMIQKKPKRPRATVIALIVAYVARQ